MRDTLTVETDAPHSEEEWIRMLRVPAKEAKPCVSAWRKLAVGGLIGFIIAMTLVVRAECLKLPDGALAGLVLRAQIGIAELLPRSSAILVEVEQRPLSAIHGSHALRTRARLPRHRRSSPSASGQQADLPATAGSSHLQVLPIRPLLPFNVEVVSGGRHRLLAARSSGVQVEIPDAKSLLTPRDTEPSAQPAGLPATLRALISPEGRVEDLWLIRGVRPSPAALNTIRQGRYQPYLVNGTPVEMEALIILDQTPPQPGPPISSPAMR